jgi:hypothetical protein
MNKSAPNTSDFPGISIRILGIGEITTTIEVKGKHWGKLHPTEKRMMRLAYKRMPAFDDKETMDHYLKIHNDYQDLLEELGIGVPWHDNLIKRRGDGRWVVYNRQERFGNRKVACLMIREMDEAGCMDVFKLLLDKMGLFFTHNDRHPEKTIGFDAQISNWVFTDYDPEQKRIRPDEPVVYIDTSTPLMRIDGVEQLDTELFLRAIPAVGRAFVRRFFLAEVVDRYYRPRDVILDLIASFITHGRPDLVPALVAEANRFMAASEFARHEKPFTEKQIKAYNREDVMIWHIFRTFKRIDRFIGEAFLKKKYEQRLPKGSPKKWENLVGAGGMGLVPEEEE